MVKGKKNINKFILLSNQRSGSTALRLALNNHSKIRCHDEVLLKESNAKDAINEFVLKSNLIKQYKRKDYHGNSWIRRRLLYQHVPYNYSLSHANNKFTAKLIKDFLEELFYSPSHSGPWTSINNWNEFHTNENFEDQNCVGFKLMYYELFNSFILNWIKENDVKVIHLIRQNKLERILSSKLAKKRSQWHSEIKMNDVKINLNCKGLIERIENEIQEDHLWQEEFEDLNYLQVSYEDFKASNSNVLKRISDFFELDDENIETPLKKISGNPFQVLSNYDEVKQELNNTKFQHFLS